MASYGPASTSAWLQGLDTLQNTLGMAASYQDNNNSLAGV